MDLEVIPFSIGQAKKRILAHSTPLIIPRLFWLESFMILLQQGQAKVIKAARRTKRMLQQTKVRTSMDILQPSKRSRPKQQVMLGSKRNWKRIEIEEII